MLSKLFGGSKQYKLLIAIDSENIPEIVKYGIDYGDKLYDSFNNGILGSETYLTYALNDKKIWAAKTLINNFPNLLYICNSKNEFPICFIIGREYNDLLEGTLHRGIVQMARDKMGLDLLQYAFNRGSNKAVGLIHDYYLFEDGMTPLHKIVDSHDYKAMQNYVNLPNINLKKTWRDRYTAFHMAVISADMNSVNIFLNAPNFNLGEQLKLFSLDDLLREASQNKKDLGLSDEQFAQYEQDVRNAIEGGRAFEAKARESRGDFAIGFC